jgi:hypothetical protein
MAFRLPKSREDEYCCDLRLLPLRNDTATSKLIPDLCIGKTKLINNKLGLHVVYIASYYLSGTRIIKLPFALQQVYVPSPAQRAFLVKGWAKKLHTYDNLNQPPETKVFSEIHEKA